MIKPIIVPLNYDYVGVYLTDKCFLKCPYCITRHHKAKFGQYRTKSLTAEEWVKGLNRFVLPNDVPITLQGGEPFLYKGVWEILENIKQKVDIMTALPPFLKKEHFSKLKTLKWNQRKAPYPTIRVSYHRGQNDYKKLVERIAELQEVVSIGLYYLSDPTHDPKELADLKAYAKKFHIDLRPKEYLGVVAGKQQGTLLFPDAVVGKRLGVMVLCKNTVVPIGPDGNIYLCHSDLYFNRQERVLGNVLDEEFTFPQEHLPCDNYGLCNECDVKVKTNHYQQYGYTSVDIKFLEK